MKSKCSFILKSSIALILTALMIFGSVSTVLAATVDLATSGWALNSGNKIYFVMPTQNWVTNNGASIIYDWNDNRNNSKAESLTHISNTDLYYKSYSSTVSNSCGVAFLNASWDSQEDNSIVHRRGYAGQYTSTKDYPFSESSTYFKVVHNSDGATNGDSYTVSNNTSYATLLQAKQTVKIYTDSSNSATGGKIGYSYYTLSAASTSKANTGTYSLASNTANAVPSVITLTPTANSGYKFDGWYSDSGLTTKITDGVNDSGVLSYHVRSARTVYAKFTTSSTPLSAPTIKYNSATTTPVSMDAAKGSKARITWAAVTNAGSYEVFKDGTSKGTTTNLYYDIERGNSYGGTYTVKAIPSNTASYSTSDASNGIKFTFNKVALTAPTVTPDKTTILSNEKVTFTLSGGASSGTLGTDYKYQHSGANNTTYADVTGSSWQTGALDNVTTADVSDIFKFKTVALSTDYYSSSTGTTNKTITVKPAFGVDSGSTSTFTPGDATAMSYDSAKAAYYLNVTLTSTSNYYFRINQMGADPKWSGSWNGSYPNVNDVVVDGAKVAADNDVSGWDNKASLHYNGAAKKIIIWFDYANKKVWIEGNSTKYDVTITQPSATGSSIKVNDATTSPQQFFDGDTVNYSVTAGSGNVITGVTINGTTTAVDRKTSYTGSFDITGNTTITATVVPQYSITKNTAIGGSYTVNRGSTTVTTFIAGDVLTITPTPDAHYDFTKFAITGGKTYTITTSPYTLDTTGATGNITITPTWTPTTYTSLTAVGKYSTDGSTYGTAMPTAPTIKATSGTYQTGVQVTAPDVSGYKFVEWYTDKGTFGNSADKQTIFKPNANGAQAVARYKKLFTITSSVESGTGAGTVTTDKTSVEAGGSYTITATPKSGSAIESVKANDTAKTATDSQTISSVSADQTVVVKFKSNVKLKGSMNPTAWSGEVMTAADKSVASYSITKELAANTTYSFKHFVETNTWSTTVDSWNLNNVATHSTADDNNGGTNLTITPSVKVNVTFTSDGSKFTSITAVPADATKYNVTFNKTANTTITGEYMGTAFTTASADAVVSVYKGTDISFKVTAASGYHISALTGASSPTFSPVVSDYKITNVTADKTVTPTAAADVNITAKTNKSSRGTVTIDKNKSFKGDTVKITVTPLAGTLKTLTASYANGDTYEWKSGNTWDKVKAGTSASNALLGAFLSSAKDKFALAPTGAETDEAAIAALPDLAPVGAAQTINMVMQEDSAVTINATFDTYSGESTWYYNGYDTSGNAVSGYHSKQMTESMVGGEKFSYYHVEGRTGTDQLMTVSNGAASSGTRYVYFTNLKSGGWDYSHSPYAYFIGASNSWPGYKMTWYTDNDMGQPVYRVAIPSGATGVVFNDNSTHKSTDINDLASGGYYVDEYSEWDGSNSVHTGHSYSCSYPSAGASSSGTEYFYDSEIYTADFSTKGFHNHNTAGKDFAKPKDLGTNTGDYYINVLYAGKTYTINGVSKTIGSKPLVIWSAEPLAGDDENVTVYAKDGAIRGETFGSTYANIADTKIYAANGTTPVGTKRNGSITNQTYETYKAAKGDTIVIKTTIGATDTSTLSNAADLKAKYYVRGFCINGEVPVLLEKNDTGVYTLTYKVPEDFEGKSIEITPIYYLKDTEANPIVTYRVTGFTDELKAVGTGKPGWGDTLYTYPFYGKLGGQNNAFGAYPGQPMVYYKGQYQMQIPVKSTAWDPYEASASTVNNTTVSGVTMSNGYWDSVHKSIMGYGDNSTSADHVQTYDYGDFYKIFNEKKPVNNIVFDFKYRTAKHNLTDIITTNTTASALESKYGTGGNGFELLTNFHGRNVDLFGTPLSGDAADPSKTTPVYVVSTGGVIDNTSGVENIAGYYATEWVVYGNTSGTTYQRITGGSKNSIPPEVLVLNDDDDTSFNTGTYPSAVDTTAKPYKITDWKALYTALEAYRGKPVMISYEAADAQQGQEMYYTGTGGATRNDGRWLYSKNGENITSNIKIQYSDDNGVTYHDLDKTTPQVNGLSAYFTNDGVEGQMTYSTTIDPDKTFDFEAKTTNGNYKFVGWYMEDGTKITSDNASYTERSGSYTFVAKFMQVTTGQLILSHSADKGTISGTDYQGVGTTQIGAVVKNGDEVIRTYDLSTSDITLDDKIIKSDSTYTIDITLTALPTGIDRDGTTVLATPSGQDAKFFNDPTVSTSGDGIPIRYTFTISVSDLFTGTHQDYNSLIYHSYFLKTSFHYNLVFQYYDRNGETKQYYRSGYLTAAQASNPEYVSVVETTPTSHERRLMPAFIEKVAPHISNFAQDDVVWDIAPEGYAFSVMNYNYTLERPIVTRQQGTNTKDVTFVLPYAHKNGIATVDGDKVGTADTTTNFTLNGENAVDFDTIPVLPDEGVNGIYTEDTWKNWIAAPATIIDGSDTLYFQYWSVKKTTAAGDDDPELARCYFQGFNFVALDNYTVTAVYDTQSTDISKSGIYTGASYLETSRNQWNGNATTGEIDHYTVDPSTGKKKASAADRAAAADLLYNDFVLNYNYNGVDIYKGESDSDGIQDLGVVVERIKELDINQDGSKNTNIANYTSVAENLDTVRGVINGTSTNSKFIKDSIAKTALDNKNRIKFYEAFYNGAGWVKDNQDYASKYAYKNYVYRAYTYIKYTDGQGQTQIQLSVPTYFTMYDEATAGYSAPTTNTSGN